MNSMVLGYHKLVFSNLPFQLKNIEKSLALRQSETQKKSAELFQMEEDLRLLRKDICEEIQELGGEEMLEK